MTRWFEALLTGRTFDVRGIYSNGYSSITTNQFMHRRCLFLLLLLPILSYAQSDSARVSGTNLLQVGVVEAPPYGIKDEQGNWDGMSIRLWRRIAEKSHLTYNLVEVLDSDQAAAKLENREIQVALHVELAPEMVGRIRYLQHHHTSNLAVALPKSTTLLTTLKAFFTKELLFIVLGLSVLLLLVGTIIYFVERSDNEDDFGGERSTLQGIGSGFWWAGVTMTTIGYGDKAPTTVAGRAVAMIWMLIAIGISATLTAAIINASNAQNTVSFPDDLSTKKVVAVENSAAADFLQMRGIEFTPVKEALDGLTQLSDSEIDLFVGSSAEINYRVNNNDNLSASVQSTDARPITFALALRPNDPLAEPLDRAVIEYLSSANWLDVKNQYLGK